MATLIYPDSTGRIGLFFSSPKESDVNSAHLRKKSRADINSTVENFLVVKSKRWFKVGVYIGLFWGLNSTATFILSLFQVNKLLKYVDYICSATSDPFGLEESWTPLSLQILTHTQGICHVYVLDEHRAWIHQRLQYMLNLKYVLRGEKGSFPAPWACGHSEFHHWPEDSVQGEEHITEHIADRGLNRPSRIGTLAEDARAKSRIPAALESYNFHDRQRSPLSLAMHWASQPAQCLHTTAGGRL